MNSKKDIDNFLVQRTFAVVGVSRSGKKFGNNVYAMLKDRGCTVYAINRYGANVNGERCYARLKDLPETVEGVVIVVPPKETEHIVKEAAEIGIRRVWMQQGSESRAAVQFCEQYGLNAIFGKCIFMFAEPVISFHKVHKWLMKVMHKLPN